MTDATAVGIKSTLSAEDRREEGEYPMLLNNKDSLARLDITPSYQSRGVYIPTIPTFLPGPVPLRTRGEYAVRPAQSIGAASSDWRSSGMGKVKCSWARICDEYPPCARVPSA